MQGAPQEKIQILILEEKSILCAGFPLISFSDKRDLNSALEEKVGEKGEAQTERHWKQSLGHIYQGGTTLLIKTFRD